MTASHEATLIVAPSKDVIPEVLNSTIVSVCAAALAARGAFTIALSGGSLPMFLSTVHQAFEMAKIEPRYDCWHVILADERCVALDDPGCNMKAIQENFLSKINIPTLQCHSIDEAKLKESAESIANAYQDVVEKVLQKSDGRIDMAILGFGPDGHTCSLFPGHALLEECEKLVSSLEDSPKPPPKRITLTIPVLNSMTRHIVFCGAGRSKSPILQTIFQSVSLTDNEQNGVHTYQAILVQPPIYPCAMITPKTLEDLCNTLTWVVDSDAMEGVNIVSKK